MFMFSCLNSIILLLDVLVIRMIYTMLIFKLTARFKLELDHLPQRIKFYVASIWQMMLFSQGDDLLSG